MLIEMAGAQVDFKLLLGSAEMNKCLFLVHWPPSREGEEVSHPRVRFADVQIKLDQACGQDFSCPCCKCLFRKMKLKDVLWNVCRGLQGIAVPAYK